MKSRFRIWMIAAVFLFSGFTSGCTGLLGPNVNLNFIVPLGFGGAPGLFNPFGIVQAIVNAMLGEALNPAQNTAPTQSGQTAPPLSPGTIGAIID